MPDASGLLLPKAWAPLRPHPVQQQYYHSTARFNVVPAGRRSGKSLIAKRRLVRKALGPQRFDNGRYFAAAPTWRQTKDIFWRDLKALVPPHLRLGRPSESELVIRTQVGSEIYLFGLDRPERMEGAPWDFGIIDEIANVDETAWPEHIQPALADRKGGCDFIGVPEGRNHFHKLHLEAMAREQEALANGVPSEWRHFHWKSKEILDDDEMTRLMRDTDELTFAQEYEASFVDFRGRAYHCFRVETHAKPLRYRSDADLVFCFDFNTSPGVAAIIQEQLLPQPNGTMLAGTGVIGEVWIRLNSTTPAVCRKLIEDWGSHRGRIFIYGDATGGAKGSAKTQGSDWEIVRRELRPAFAGRLIDRVPSSNPRERFRINSVNSRLLSQAGEIKLMVDPRTSPRTVEDFEGTALLEGAGEIDKVRYPLLSHLTDAIGYYIAEVYPILANTMVLGKARG